MAANTGVKQGQDIILYIETETSTWSAIGHGTNHSVEEDMETRDRASKDTGMWRRKVPGLLGWSVSCEALSLYDGYTYHDIKALKDARNLVKVKVAGRAAVGDNDTWVPEATDDKYLQGSGYITSLSENHPNNEDSTLSVTIEGDGELETKTVTAE